VFLDGGRRSAQQTPALRRHGKTLTTPVQARRDFRDEPLSDQPLNHDRHGALMRTGERRDVIDGRIGMLSDLLKRKQLCAAQPRMALAGTTDPQRLHDVPEGVEGHSHLGRISDATGVRGVFHDSKGPRWRTGVWRGRGWRFVTHVDIVDYMGFHIS
jgi:hypothetical protein